MHPTDDLGPVSMIACFVLLFTQIVAFFTHISWSISLLMADHTATVFEYSLAALGVLFPPAGIVHGVWLWF